MPEVRAYSCPQCNAPMAAPRPGQVAIRCDYCGHELSIKHTVQLPPAPPQQPPQPWMPPRPPVVPIPLPPQPHIVIHAPRVARTIGAIALLPVVIGLGVAGYVAYQVKRSMSMATSSSAPGGTTQSEEKFQWDSQFPPLVADVDGDGVEDMIGLYRVVGSSQPPTYLGAFSGKTWQKLWMTSPLEGASYQLRIGAAGDAILIGDERGKVQVIDRATGKVRVSALLSDRANRFCAPAEGGAWIEVADDKHVLIDLTSGTLEPSPVPDGCEKTESWPDCSSWELAEHPARARCVARDEQGKVDGMYIGYALRAGAHQVALGNKDKGTTFSMIAGFDAATAGKKNAAPTWVRTVNPDERDAATMGAPQVADIADGTLYVMFASKPGPQLAAIDAATGTTRWQVPIPRAETGSAANAMTISDQRLYLPHWVWLDVFDRATGKHLATIGSW